ncbi:hypothetical protein [uncultured Mucilaginibacter sp.]|uniref:hypothetical protein n=1 Tax=uncultured Mucilaginibacter sp. TaxID=797541 RepID=UPI0026277E65|nr:hypothetical protein [uncultured Mucilaginibacter sp.]
MEEDKEGTFTTLKGYKLFILLIFLLLVLGIGYWLVKRRALNSTEVRKDGVLRQLDQRTK